MDAKDGNALKLEKKKHKKLLGLLLPYIHFSNSSIIHKENTKEIHV